MKLLYSTIAVLLLVAVASADGWYESSQYPGWWVRYQNGRIVEWQRMKQKQREVETDAVIRMGDTVTHIDGKHRNTMESLWAHVVGGLPPDDSHKWFILVVGQQGNAACAKLKQDWATSEYLRAFARPELDQQKESFMHFHWFDKDDESQKWRFSDKITAYPTVLMTPPRNGKYGTPGTVVFQQVYGMNTDPKRFTDDMRSALKLYVSKHPPLAQADDETLLPVPGAIAAPPPVKVIPKVDAGIDPSILPPDPAQHLKIPPKSPSVIPGGGGWLQTVAWVVGGLCCFSVVGVMGVTVLVLLVRQAKATSPPLVAPVPQQASTPSKTIEDRMVEGLTAWVKDRQQSRAEEEKVLAAMRKLTQVDTEPKQ